MRIAKNISILFILESHKFCQQKFTKKSHENAKKKQVNMSIMYAFTLTFINILAFIHCMDVKVATDKHCSQYDAIIENAQVEMQIENNRSVVRVRCHSHFDLRGPDNIVCVGGKWYPSQAPKCIQKCMVPPYIDHGVRTLDQTVDTDTGKYPVGTVANYTCHDNYKLTPSQSNLRVCEMGVWTGPLGICVPLVSFRCKKPKVIKYGYYTPENTNIALMTEEHGDMDSYDVGQRLHYACKTGYSLLGPNVQICLEDGTWSPKLPPYCGKKDDDQKRRCGPPPTSELTTIENVKHGVILANGEATFGTELQIRCESGFRDERYPCHSVLLRCVAPGIWDGPILQCVPVDSCNAPPPLSNGVLLSWKNAPFSALPMSSYKHDEDTNELYSDGDSDEVPSLLYSRYSIGSVAHYKCLQGYKLRGDSMLTCGDNGCWQYNTPPLCVIDLYYVGDTSSLVIILVLTSSVFILMSLLLCSVLIVRTKKHVAMQRTLTPTSATTTRTMVSFPVNGTNGPPPPFPGGNREPTTFGLDPDRLALIAFAENQQNSQCGLPTYEEAMRSSNTSCLAPPTNQPTAPILPQRVCRSHWTFANTSRSNRARGSSSFDGVTRQNNSNSHAPSIRSNVSNSTDPMGSTDTMTPSEVSTNVTLDTVSSNSGSQVASCRAMCGSLASFDTSSVHNNDGIPLLEENELEEVTSALEREHNRQTDATLNGDQKRHANGTLSP